MVYVLSMQLPYKIRKAVIDNKMCRVCGRCTEICSNDALTVYISSDAVDRSVERVEKLVDVESSK